MRQGLRARDGPQRTFGRASREDHGVRISGRHARPTDHGAGRSNARRAGQACTRPRSPPRARSSLIGVAFVRAGCRCEPLAQKDTASSVEKLELGSGPRKVRSNALARATACARRRLADTRCARSRCAQERCDPPPVTRLAAGHYGEQRWRQHQQQQRRRRRRRRQRQQQQQQELQAAAAGVAAAAAAAAAASAAVAAAAAAAAVAAAASSEGSAQRQQASEWQRRSS